ncbi:hypothetical protein JHD49_01480 [Sulfurimonas sp. SAG-AH-194-C21]|nr:hypothetical protein [Sulfurimonas sp. SAG-AH-194-C21]MDF1882606.1 hypothetical protein [Sulfurimonas sp. SAG-AH-194-C21]
MLLDLDEFVSYLEELHRRIDIGDNVEILYADNLVPVKINGEIKPELKIFKASYCIYEMEEFEYFNSSNSVEMLVIEEYSDSPNSIYIDQFGDVDSYEYENISSIELGETLVIEIENRQVKGYLYKKFQR